MKNELLNEESDIETGDWALSNSWLFKITVYSV